MPRLNKSKPGLSGCWMRRRLRKCLGVTEARVGMELIPMENVVRPLSSPITRVPYYARVLSSPLLV
jgi:hypothetical protein